MECRMCRISRIVGYAGQKSIAEIGQIQGTAIFVSDMANVGYAGVGYAGRHCSM